MIVALIINEDDGDGWYVYQAQQAEPGVKFYIGHEDMSDAFVYIAGSNVALDAYVEALNNEHAQESV